MEPDGKIIVVGTDDPWTNAEMWVIARFNADGTLDTTFAPVGSSATVSNALGTITDYGGYETFSLSGDDVLYNVTVQDTGKLVLAGTVDRTGDGYDNVLVRLNADGSLDDSFGSAGNGEVDLGQDEEKVTATVSINLSLEGTSSIIA